MTTIIEMEQYRRRRANTEVIGSIIGNTLRVAVTGAEVWGALVCFTTGGWWIALGVVLLLMGIRGIQSLIYKLTNL